MHDNVNIVSTEQKLLFDIRQLLIEQNELIRSLSPKPKEIEIPKEIKAPKKAIPQKLKKNGGKHK